MKNKQHTWLAAHLYYAEPWEAFLKEAVQPFAEQILQGQLAEQYFFICYWEKGPHIRLRFLAPTSRLERVIKPKLMDYFSRYFHHRPSFRKEPAWLAELPEEQAWYPNDSIQFIAYEPEINRYGGEQAMTVAEQQFCSSSRTILSAMAESQQWSYERALGAGIQLHLSMLYQLGLSQTEACQFFHQIFTNWLPRAYVQRGEAVTPAMLHQRKEEVVQAFDQSYNRQKEQILPMVRTLWEGLEEQADFGQPWLRQWMDDMQKVAGHIATVQKNGQLGQPTHFVVNPSLPVAPAHQIRWAIYDSYVHMTNNRLGILNRDEGYLGYLLLRVLREI
ncbi:MAG: thiopeptide-type bacteriocin biosynthesis protein [Cyclobacteriaceae bacterium]